MRSFFFNSNPLFTIPLLQKQRTWQERRGWGFNKGPPRKKEADANKSATPTSLLSWRDAVKEWCSPFTVENSPQVIEELSRILYLWSIIDPRIALMAWKVPQCSYPPQWSTDLSGKSPKSGQFCTQGKWTTLAQTDLISVWFTTSNHLMSQCRIHIIHSSVFLSENHDKSVGKKGTFWIEGCSFSALSLLAAEHNGHEMRDKKGSKNKLNIILQHTALLQHDKPALMLERNKITKWSTSDNFESW